MLVLSSVEPEKVNPVISPIETFSRLCERRIMFKPFPEERFFELCRLNDIDLAVYKEVFRAYYDLLQKWNAKINITRNDQDERFLCENLFDPILALKAWQGLDVNSRVLVDLGAGGGFVGILWAVISDQFDEVFLVDSDRRKINFCREVCRALKLKPRFSEKPRASVFQRSLNCIHQRVDEFLKSDRLKGRSLLVSRATFAFTELLDLVKNRAKPGDCLISFEGPSFKSENPSHHTLFYEVKPSPKERKLIRCLF